MADQTQHNPQTERDARATERLAEKFVKLIEDHPTIDDGRLGVCALLLAMGRICGAYGNSDCVHADWINCTMIGFPLFDIGWGKGAEDWAEADEETAKEGASEH